MRRITFLTIFSVLFFLSVSSSAEILTLEECIQNAIQNDSSIIQERLKIQSLELKISQSQKEFSPEASVSQGISYSDSSGKESYSTRLSLSHTLDDGGTRANNLSIAKLNLEKEKEEYKRLINDLKYNISVLYYQIQQRKQSIELQESILERRKKDLVLIRLKYHAGKESLQAVNESETSYKEAEYRKLKEERDLANIYFEINTAMGKDMQFVFDTVDVDYSYREFNSKDLITISIENRAELKKLDITRKINLLSRKNINAGYKPKLTASMNESLSGDEIFKNDSFGASISLSYKLYDGGKKNDLLKESDNTLRSNENEIKKMRDDITIEVYNALKNYELAYAKLQIDELTLKAKKDIYLLTKLKYEQGSETYFTFQTKETDLSQAEYDYVSSLHNLKTSLLSLEKVTGGKI